ncbi:hypothetical protein BDW71DRAFT_169975 [Aspergillus fruticulosus]
MLSVEICDQDTPLLLAHERQDHRLGVEARKSTILPGVMGPSGSGGKIAAVAGGGNDKENVDDGKRRYGQGQPYRYKYGKRM